MKDAKVESESDFRIQDRNCVLALKEETKRKWEPARIVGGQIMGLSVKPITASV